MASRASRALREASLVIAESPAALQLRYLQTLNTITAEKNSTIIFPLPLEMFPGTERIRQNTLTLKEFQKARDSGIYYCSSFNNNILNFGKATHIDGVPVLHSKIKCELMIFAPLAGGCALLILILIITICYCNRIRTKRCPHHYKRRPKNSAAVRQAMPDRYV
ncbi:T-cell surface glycoprotein CD8 alpha chain-like [Conger conger]|uniref:T-cell surface glycoprotein CD8 alpha chain-like n=1 Tax=Conger conger TaxID=82655 RepID=UPI002A59C182|nr:T-cell surface glycoprotein CD8 alpha chain-like [Conger conger]